MLLSLLILAAVVAIGAFLMFRHPAFGRAPRGARVERIRLSPNFRDGQFRNLHPTPQITSGKGFAGTMWSFLFAAKDPRRTPSEPLPTVNPDLHNLDRGEEVLVWFGHSSYFLQTHGVRFLVDPVFSDKWPMSMMFHPFPGTDVFSADDIPAVDVLIITHDHWDHLDYDTVTRLRERVGRVVCPLGVGEHLEYWGYAPSQIIEMDWNEQAALADGFTIDCLPARHFSGRTLRRNATLWASYLIQTPSQRIYLSGDGGYDDHFADIARRFAPIDLAVMENGQYNKDWSYIHLLPEKLVQAIHELQPRRTLTVHHSKFALARHAWDEPLRLVEQAAGQDNFPLLTPVIGERVVISPLQK